MITITFQPEDLTKVRFAFSPLIELVESFCVYRREELHATYWRWVEEAQRALYDVELPFMEAAMPSFKYVADFLTPTPETTETDFEVELSRITDTPDELIIANIRYAAELDGWTETRRYFVEHPREGLEKLIDELRLYWNRTLAHHWEKMIPTLENDILYHAREMALHGTDTVLQNINPGFKFEDSTLTLPKSRPGVHDRHFTLHGDGLQIVPSLFIASHYLYMFAPEWKPMLSYGARGYGGWYTASREEPNQALEVAMGETRARVLTNLSEPANTGELATRLSVTSAAISQHMERLRQAGLVESHRIKNRVYHQLSPRGNDLMRLFS